MNEPVPNQVQLLTFCEFPGPVSVPGRLLLLQPQVPRTQNLCILVRLSDSHGDAVRLARDDRLAGFLDLLEHRIVRDLVRGCHVGGLGVQGDVVGFHA
jgi:hypothetical protein